MEVIQYLKQIYSGKRALSTHIMLFSLVGMAVLMLNNVASTLGNNLFLSFYTVAPSSQIELWLDTFLGFIFFFYLLGYEYYYLNKIVNNQKVNLPEFDNEPYYVFFKVIPVFILWQLYYTILAVVGGILVASFKSSLYHYLFISILICITPFIFMIFVTFSKDFKYRKEVLSPFVLFKYIEISLMSVILWCIQYTLFAIIPVLLILGLLEVSFLIKSDNLRLVVSMGTLCLASYVFTVLKFIFGAGIANIVKSKFLFNRE